MDRLTPPDGTLRLPVTHGIRAFTMVELLVAMAVVATLVALGMGAFTRSLSTARQADSVARLRTLGQAIFLFAGDNDQRLPGPLWPGQVMLYDATKDGRIVRELASYLGIKEKSAPYLVTQMIPMAYRGILPGVRMEDKRIYVMNSSIEINGQTKSPFGSLTTSPVIPPMQMSQMRDLPEADRWMVSEADQMQPYVATAPWKTSTPPVPVHQGRRAVLKFDGSVELKRVTP